MFYIFLYFVFFFFKQKTAYEMRISDWSSDVCSSDLDRIGLASPATTSLPGVEAMDAELNTDWSAAGDAELADVIALRRAIHAEPEIGLHCPRTTEKLKAAIADLPLEIREGPSTTGFVAILRGGSDNGRTVLLRRSEEHTSE